MTTNNTNQLTNIAKIKARAKNKAIIMVSGYFSLLHIGHIRLLHYAKTLNGFLVVAIRKHAQTIQNDDLAMLKSLANAVIFIDGDYENFVVSLQPHIILRGDNDTIEAKQDFAIGKKLPNCQIKIAPGNYFDLLNGKPNSPLANIIDDEKYLAHHQINKQQLSQITQQFKGLRVAVIGDIILDKYIECELVGLSREDTTIVYTPLADDSFLGGAAIMAVHAASLGAKCHLVSVLGDDHDANEISRLLKNQAVNMQVHTDKTRKTISKNRYRHKNKTIFRANNVNMGEISPQHAQKISEFITNNRQNLDIIFLADFSYGTLPDYLIKDIITIARENGIFIAADSQSSSQQGDFNRFFGVDLITPTEYEARLAIDSSKNMSLMDCAKYFHNQQIAKNIMITLGSQGVFVHQHVNETIILGHQIRALNPNPADVSGAGDLFLIISAMALRLGANIWQAAYLGSVASAIHVATVGNRPIDLQNINEILNR